MPSFVLIFSVATRNCMGTVYIKSIMSGSEIIKGLCQYHTNEYKPASSRDLLPSFLKASCPSFLQTCNLSNLLFLQQHNFFEHFKMRQTCKLRHFMFKQNKGIVLTSQVLEFLHHLLAPKVLLDYLHMIAIHPTHTIPSVQPTKPL